MQASRFIPNRTPCGRTRREFLWQAGGAFTSVALAGLLSRDGFLNSQAVAADGAPDDGAEDGRRQQPHVEVQRDEHDPERGGRAQVGGGVEVEVEVGADGLVEGGAAVQGRVVLTRSGRLLADAVVRRLLS